MGAFDDLLNDLDESQSTEGWTPEPGDVLLGTVTKLDTRESEYQDEPYPIVTVEVADGSTEEGDPIEEGEARAFHAFRSVARSEVEDANPQKGDLIAIRYDGKVKGKRYHGYSVRSKAQD